MGHTFDWTRQFEVIQMTSENVVTKFIRILHDLNEQIASGQFALLKFGQGLGCIVEWLTLTVSPKRQWTFNVCWVTENQSMRETTTKTIVYGPLTKRRVFQLLRFILQGPPGVRSDRLRVQPH